MLNDQLFYPDSLDAQQWLIYFISRPLLGTYDQIKLTPAVLQNGAASETHVRERKELSTEPGGPGSSYKDKQDVKTFNWLLNNFPMIARQMQPGLEKVFEAFRDEMRDQQKAASKTSSTRSPKSPTASIKSNGSIHSKHSNGHPIEPTFQAESHDGVNNEMRAALETAVTAAIDLFQQVDKQQLSFLGSTTDLTGSAVERLIERYVTEHLHDAILFPALRSTSKIEDSELESRIHSMQHIDVAQVGIAIEDGRKGKEQLIHRIDRGVEEFRMLAVAGSPQEMMDVLLKTQKSVASDTRGQHDQEVVNVSEQAQAQSEKASSAMTMNADTLVSLLLVVVIRSQVRYLHARLTYMRDFMFIDDVESGERGYALSTFEAVLSYLASDSGGLRKASRTNRRLWQATTKGDLAEVKSFLEPALGEDNGLEAHEVEDEAVVFDEPDDKVDTRIASRDLTSISHGESATENGYTSEGSTLAHVFPFEAATAPPKHKRVSMDMRSLSNASDSSFISRTTTLDSRNSVIEGDTSIETLAQTQDVDENSILMMAVEARRADVLEYLLTLDEHFPPHIIMEDLNKEGTTLLSAAVQLADAELIEVILHSILRIRERTRIVAYIAKPDKRGRTVAHYMFNAPNLIPRFCDILPWRIKDKNGQTPLLALCRSYDHPAYSEMVNQSLQFSTDDQGDGQPLHLDDHIDGKGNTLLHVVNDPSIAVRILRQCDSDANATNDKHFTPLMVASKYGRMDMVRTLFADKRVDPLIKESRGMTAVELAKDDEVRNRIDDMVLVSNVPAANGRVTAVVRSLFIEDASIRLIIKSAIRNENGTIGVTACRRSLTDFEDLAKWLSREHPASWLSSIFNFRSPFQISSRPSKAVLQDIQERLDKFLKIMLAHSTFSTHELLWEFILFPEIQPEMMAERSRKKAEIRSENIQEEYEPVEDVKEILTFMEHARDSIRGIDHSTKSVIRRTNSMRVGLSSQ